MSIVGLAWRAVVAGGASAIVMIALGAPAVPVLLGVCLATGVLWWKAQGPR